MTASSGYVITEVDDLTGTTSYFREALSDGRVNGSVWTVDADLALRLSLEDATRLQRAHGGAIEPAPPRIMVDLEGDDEDDDL